MALYTMCLLLLWLVGCFCDMSGQMGHLHLRSGIEHVGEPMALAMLNKKLKGLECCYQNMFGDIFRNFLKSYTFGLIKNKSQRFKIGPNNTWKCITNFTSLHLG